LVGARFNRDTGEFSSFIFGDGLAVNFKTSSDKFEEVLQHVNTKVKFVRFRFYSLNLKYSSGSAKQKLNLTPE
jgi:hypothetical protein